MLQWGFVRLNFCFCCSALRIGELWNWLTLLAAKTLLRAVALAAKEGAFNTELPKRNIFAN